MSETLKIETLKELLAKGKHDIGKANEILPFSSRKILDKDAQFNGVLGELIRIICGLEIDQKATKNKEFHLTKEENRLSEQIANNLEFNNEDDIFDFVRFLNEYLFNKDEIKPIHPYLFNYIETKKNGEFTKLAQFINDILVQNNKQIISIFTNKESDDILTELILEKLDSLKERKTNLQQYQSLKSPLIKQYQEDIIYLSKYKDYFLNSFPLITQYYVFMYVCQLLIKMDLFTDGDLEEVRPIFFALDWESISKRRQSASDLEGFKLIKNKSNNLFPHIHTLSQLSYNIFNEELWETDRKLKVLTYKELYEMIKNKGQDFEDQFLNDLKKWIEEYREIKKIKTADNSESIPEAFDVLFNCLKEGMNKDVFKNYGKNIEYLGSSQFIKSRGSLGQILNIKHDFLLLLTAVSVKDKRIPLNELFLEFEKRGLAFDRYSKREIITLFDNLNILDKKSDSGDAQYVKPIL